MRPGRIKDVFGVWWNIRETRATRHGFDLYFGTPVNGYAGYFGGVPHLIPTRQLTEFWDANRTASHGFLFDLPAGRTTLKRMRRKLGFNFREDINDFWMSRLDDLATLESTEFAFRHGVDVSVVRERRHHLIGRLARESGWWRKPKYLRVLLSDASLSEIGRKLEISISHAKRLRDRARQEATPRTMAQSA